jgi:hypothetical protein
MSREHPSPLELAPSPASPTRRSAPFAPPIFLVVVVASACSDPGANGALRADAGPGGDAGPPGDADTDTVGGTDTGAGADTGSATDRDTSPDTDTDTDTPPNVGLQATSGWQIYAGGSYRYGPSIIVDDSGTTHMWTSSPGDDGVWDYIRYRTSTDGGVGWSDDVVVLEPTPGSRDALSTCDPGVIRIGGYWYIGYTSTEDTRGTDNQLYVARASSPSGPYEKWDGSGWGGDPQPMVSYSGSPDSYGIGEPSLVLVDGRLFVYYSYLDGSAYTDLAIAEDGTAEDWPAHLVSHGHVITRRSAEDSTDVKYVAAYERFVGVATSDRFGPNATIVVYQSEDGIVFEPAPYKGARVQEGAHNAGLSGDPSGHLDDAPFVAYAYQPPENGWGDWPTFLDPVALTTFPWGTTVAGGVSSIVGDADWNWSGPRAWDGDLSTVFSSESNGATPDATEYVMVDLGKSYAVTGLAVYPRSAGMGFPEDFVVQTSPDDASWTDVPGSAEYGFPNPGDAVVSLPFDAEVEARYVRLVATRLGVDDFGNAYLQLAELVPEVR